jgi:hypothetical protein
MPITSTRRHSVSIRSASTALRLSGQTEAVVPSLGLETQANPRVADARSLPLIALMMRGQARHKVWTVNRPQKRPNSRLVSGIYSGLRRYTHHAPPPSSPQATLGTNQEVDF